MKQDWHVEPLPPPDESYDSPDVFEGLALWALILIGPMIYFGHELGAIETWLLSAYRSLENLLLPIREWFLG